MEYIKAKSLRNACQLLSKYPERAKVVSGGQSLLLLLKQRVIAPEYLIDIGGGGGVRNLPYIRATDDGLAIGALTTHRMVETSALIKKRLPMLVEMEKVVGCVQIRNRGTICGNLCHADPASDVGTALLTLGARVKAVGLGGEREIPLDDFFVGELETVLQPDEVAARVVVPKLAAYTGGTYIKESIRIGDTGIATIGAVVTLDGETISQARIALGAVGPKPLRAKQAESKLMGRKATDNLDEVAEAAAAECQPVTDSEGSAEYKRHIVKVITRQALAEAISRARKG